MAREGQGYPCYQRDMMMMMIYIYIYIIKKNSSYTFFMRKNIVELMIIYLALFFCCNEIVVLS